MASATMRTKKNPSSVQRPVHAPGAWSTPVAASSDQPGGKWSVAASCSTSADQPTARSASATRRRASPLPG